MKTRARFPRPALLLSVVSLLFVMAVVLLDIEAASPGPLSETHARDERLDGLAGCTRCHGAGGSTLGEACARCHETIEAQIDAGTGFHGTLADGIDARHCAPCHVEHHGAGVALVGERAFAAAGYDGRDAYEHDGLAFELHGAHDGLACGDCHPRADAEVLAAGETRFLGLAQDCTGCHDDEHDGELGMRCAECHGQEHAFPEVAAFVHDPAFPLRGAHDTSSCLACHDSEGRDSIAALMEVRSPARRRPEPRACAACHPSPHAEAFVAAFAERVELAPDRACAACHDPEGGGGFADGDARFDRALHAATGFALSPPHDDVACSACHARDATGDATGAAGDEPFAAFRAAYPGRDADACASCHADPHGGQFADGPFGDAGCLACHARDAFVPAAFDAEQHARTSFPLTGSHLAVGCFACHVATAEGAAESARAERVPAELEAPTSASGRARHRFAGTPDACSACHADAHRGAFAGLDEPHAAARASCDRCHDTEAFARARDSFRHAPWTAFPLEGAHRALACEACHVPARQRDATGRTFGTAAGRDCASCHADPHAGQLAVDGVTDCARCHVPAAFADLRSFDHARDTRFALDVTHAALACSACHLPHELGDGTRVVRYRPLGVECADCHDPRGGGGR